MFVRKTVQEVHERVGLIAPSMVLLTALVSLLLGFVGVHDPLILFGVTLVFLLPVSVAVGAAVSSQLRRVAAALVRLSVGEQVGPLDVTMRGPIGILARTTEVMAATIVGQKTDLERERDEKEDSLQRHEEVARILPDGLITLRGEDGTVRSFNAAAEALLGLKAADVLQKRAADVLHWPDGREHAEGLAEQLRRYGGGPLTERVSGQGPDDMPVVLRLDGTLARVKGREIVTLLVRNITRDEQIKEELERLVEERTSDLEEKNAELRRANQKHKAAERRIKEAMEQQQAFLAAICHDLRTPLGVVVGFCKELENQVHAAGHDEYLGDLSRILRQGDQLEDLIKDLLNYFRLESGGDVRTNPVELDLAALLTQWGDTIRYYARKEQNDYRLEGAEAAGRLTADGYLLRRILLNLIKNACEYTRKGTVTLAVTREQCQGRDWVRFQVRDTGKGMTPETIRHLGRRYRPGLTKSGGTANQGFGLGLAISFRYVRLMGGSVEVDSEENRGSVFTVWLPADVSALTAPPRERPAVAVDPAAESARTRRVLIIEDDEDFRELWRRHLQEEGYETDTASNGVEGLSLASEGARRPDAIVLDVMMHGLDGWGVLAALRANHNTADIPVILATIIDDEKKGYALGANDYLLKPFSRDRLSAVISRHLGGASERPLRVLVVARKPEARAELHGLLGQKGVTVAEAATSDEALRAIKADGRPDLLLLDLRLPNGGVPRVIRTLREDEDGRDVPVVVLTDFENTAEGRWFYRAEVDAVLREGAFSGEELYEHIKEVAASAAARRAAPAVSG